MSTTIRISSAAHEALRQVSMATGQTMQAALDEAYEQEQAKREEDEEQPPTKLGSNL